MLCSSSLCKLAPCILTIKTLNHKPLKTSSSWWYSSCLVYKYTELSSVRNHRLSCILTDYTPTIQKLCIFMALYVYNKTYSKEIQPGETSFSRAKGFRAFSSNQWHLSSIPQQKSFQKQPWKAWRDASWRSCDRVSHRKKKVYFCLRNRRTISEVFIAICNDRALSMASARKKRRS